MNQTLDLQLENLDPLEAPLTDREWGIVGGAAFAAGVAFGIGVVLIT
jgi:hypothetical protein